MLTLMEQSKRNQFAAYKAAGYKVEGNEGGARENAYKMAHDPRVLEALHEEALKTLKTLVPMSLQAIERIIGSDDAKNSDVLTGAKMVFDRAGLHGVAETRVVHELADDTEMLAEIRMLAARNGVPLASLLGGRLSKQIEGEFVDVTPKDE